MRRKEKGLSLIEAAMVLALAAVVIVGALYYYQVAAENKRYQSLRELTEQVLSKILVLYEGKSTTEGLNSLMIAKQLNLKTTKATIAGMGPYGYETDEKDYIRIPGSGMLMSINGDRGLFDLLGDRRQRQIGIGYHFPKQMSKSEIYNICMAMTGFYFGFPSLGYRCASYHMGIWDSYAKREKVCSGEAISARKLIIMYQL